MPFYTITVKQLVSDENLTKPDDRIDNPGGTYHYNGASEDDALDAFHGHVPIACLDDFEITAHEAKLERTTLRLTLTVTYDLNGASKSALRDNLEYIAMQAAGEGLMTGDSPAIVDEWKGIVTEVGGAQ